MRPEIRENAEAEGWDIIDLDSDQSHDGDGARELVALVYDYANALLIVALLERHGTQKPEVG